MTGHVDFKSKLLEFKVFHSLVSVFSLKKDFRWSQQALSKLPTFYHYVVTVRHVLLFLDFFGGGRKFWKWNPGVISMVVQCSTTKFIPRPWVLSNGISLCNWVCTGIHGFLVLSFSVLEFQSQVWYHTPLRFFSLRDEQTPTNCSTWCCNLRCHLLKRISKGFHPGRTTNTVICVGRAQSTNSNSKTPSTPRTGWTHKEAFIWNTTSVD